MEEKKLNFRALRPSEVEVRIQSITASGFSLLVYANARVIMNILDDTVGSMNWQRNHREVNGATQCGISIWDEKKSQWITKWDSSDNEDASSGKADASISFKRAATNWGIGRALYTVPKLIWIAPDKIGFTPQGKDNKEKQESLKNHLKKRQYDIELLDIVFGVCETGDFVKKLTIVDKSNGSIIYDWSSNQTSLKSEASADAIMLKSKIEEAGADEAKILSTYKVSTLEELVKLPSVLEDCNTRLDATIKKKKNEANADEKTEKKKSTTRGRKPKETEKTDESTDNAEESPTPTNTESIEPDEPGEIVFHVKKDAPEKISKLEGKKIKEIHPDILEAFKKKDAAFRKHVPDEILEAIDVYNDIKEK